jgi:hypothetical protein
MTIATDKVYDPATGTISYPSSGSGSSSPTSTATITEYVQFGADKTKQYKRVTTTPPSPATPIIEWFSYPDQVSLGAGITPVGYPTGYVTLGAEPVASEKRHSVIAGSEVPVPLAPGAVVPLPSVPASAIGVTIYVVKKDDDIIRMTQDGTDPILTSRPLIPGDFMEPSGVHRDTLTQMRFKLFASEDTGTAGATLTIVYWEEK